MNYIIPTRETTPEAIRRYRELLIDKLHERCINLQIADDKSRLRIRDLRAKDLGLSNWAVPDRQRHVTFVNYGLPQNMVIGIYGILQLGTDPTANSITFKVGKTGATCYGIHDLDVIYAEWPIIAKLSDILRSHDDLKEILNNPDLVNSLLSNPMEGYLTEPYCYDPTYTVYIELDLSHSGNNYLVLRGLVCEPRGLNIL